MNTDGVVVGIDNGGNANNVTVLDGRGAFLIERMLEVPSRVLEGPAVAIEALVEAFELGRGRGGRRARATVQAVGLDTPGPASATGVLSTRGATNFSNPAWWGFDIRGALEARLGLPGRLQQRRQRRCALCPSRPLRACSPLSGRRSRPSSGPVSAVA